MTYHGPQDLCEASDSLDMSSASEEKTKNKMFQDVPATEHECEQAWTALCAFEHQGVAYRPTASALIGMWKVMHTAATSEGIDLSNPFDLETLWARMEDDGYPKPLVETVLAKLSAEITGNSGCKRSLADKHICNCIALNRGLVISIDKLKCVPWVGVNMLQSRLPSQPPVDTTRFLSEWRESIPEAWRSLAELGCITVFFLCFDRGW